MAMIFRKDIYLRIAFTLTAIIFGCIVLMAHVHYSIDVLSAFFITYAIAHMAEFLFYKEKKIFNEGVI